MSVPRTPPPPGAWTAVRVAEGALGELVVVTLSSERVVSRELVEADFAPATEEGLVLVAPLDLVVAILPLDPVPPLPLLVLEELPTPPFLGPVEPPLELGWLGAGFWEGGGAAGGGGGGGGGGSSGGASSGRGSPAPEPPQKFRPRIRTPQTLVATPHTAALADARAPPPESSVLGRTEPPPCTTGSRPPFLPPG